MIASGELRAGDRLPIEKDLAARWGVSRGSLREAVRSLAALGVLETRQGDGTYVTQLDPGSLLRPLEFWADLQEVSQSVELLAVRRVLETESAGLAAVRLTDEELSRLEGILTGIEEAMASGRSYDIDVAVETVNGWEVQMIWVKVRDEEAVYALERHLRRGVRSTPDVKKAISEQRVREQRCSPDLHTHRGVADVVMWSGRSIITLRLRRETD